MRDRNANSNGSSRVQLTVRLNADDKQLFSAATQASGFESGVAVRAILELCIARIRAGTDFIDVLHILKTAMKNGAAK
jgi:hypothetical protein